MKRIWRLLGYARPYALYTAAAVVLTAAVAVLAGFRLLLIRPIFDQVLQPQGLNTNVLRFTVPHLHKVIDLQWLVPTHFHNAWTVVAYALVASALLKSLCDYAGTCLVNYAGFRMITDLRNDLYEALLRRSAAFFMKHPTGKLASTLINDIERVQTAMSTVLADFLQQMFTFVVLVGVVISYGRRMAWILLLFVPLIVSSARRIGRRVRHTTRSGQDKLAEIQNIVHEALTGHGIVKAFGMEAWENSRFQKATRRLFRANLKSVSAQALSSPLMDLLGMVAIALLLLLGRSEILRGQMTLGSFVTFLAAVFTLYDPVRKFAVFYNSFQQALGASDSIFRFLDEQDEVKEKRFARGVKPFRDKIVFENVDFDYESDDGPRRVLHSINLTVKRGDVVAIVGPSGAGKSTLANLIPRFFDPSGGRITIDGLDLRDVSLESLRRQIGKVTQETILFNDTVRNNIAYGRPDVPLVKVQRAAEMALADEFIRGMAEGYDTVIGEKGVRLSGGERQRLAIARAILKNAPILVLDEATSSLDSESEHLVQAALANLMADRTVFVIAHRLSTVRHANRIVVLEDGRITEEGSHDELMERGGTYSRLYQMQFGDAGDTGNVNAVQEAK
jgi:subfamily B ATP-binding cassette protein MsbA